MNVTEEEYTTKENFQERLESMDRFAEKYDFEIVPKEEWDDYKDEEHHLLEIYRIYRTKDKRWKYLVYVEVYHFKEELKMEDFQEPSVSYADGGNSGNDGFWYWADGSSCETNFGEGDEW